MPNELGDGQYKMLLLAWLEKVNKRTRTCLSYGMDLRNMKPE